MKKNGLYGLVLGGATLGLGWVAWNVRAPQSQLPDVCLFKRVTGLPCPSCGTTHSVVALFHLHLAEAFMLNPFGYLLFVAMLLLPVWILTDLLRRTDSFYRTYSLVEKKIRRPQMAIPLIVLVLCNWIWNLIKYTS